MGRVSVQVCLISARGLRTSHSLWKRHWFAVGWIDPKDKYCSSVDCSGSPNPVWNTKFSSLVDDSEVLNLHVQVYSRDPFFFTESLQGSTVLSLTEFLRNRRDGSGKVEDVGSYQLRKNNSRKHRGFVDVSVRILSEKGVKQPHFYPEYEAVEAAAGGGIVLLDHNNRMTMSSQKDLAPAILKGPTALPLAAQKQPILSQPEQPYTLPTPFPAKCANPCIGGPTYPSAAGPSYRPFHGRPPLPQPLQQTINHSQNYLTGENYGVTGTYVNLPSSSVSAVPRGFGIGAGAGALAAGGMMFGDELMSGFDNPSGVRPHPSVSASWDPLFP
ncbi:hypothetical protein MLD38_018832 [Melastoma candidum]|uniref:Uncharacterized protein n=1 Tax=Melastoma candidum TaxID=119954 RepID=A0ACB9QWX4_9MYRT|nr:hypothetical protein MLD38_018832 [Melastoma candidum]